ncbi:dTDP-4-dehydrorhamnose reductase [Noviherbaspirillum galbum]|uniref:dTDP-4-dehydrorhamnose reductase n=1 Tax=Noviherbaspirillum galbum TaxID=2709383 RepID=A0A6B3SYI9_9BURK|nr:dTDP-4-dehydrorhamnose reductase [Noviherbaspirillum galbum]NEX64476.1 dTDP-4-dehydrorhamnose reductase [Noviherbaspirillum galbum]
MKILLTGVNGQIGHELLRSLQGLGDIHAMDRARMDLADLDSVRRAVREIRPDLIVNPAAYTAVDQAEREPDLAMRINGEAPGVMAEEAARIGAAMVHYSTDYVFDGTKQGAYAEDDLPAPANVYGRSKLAGEQAVVASGIPHLILRTSWVYGLRGRNFLLTIRRLAQEKDELRIVSDQVGAPTWCRTISDATAHTVARLSQVRGLDLDLLRARSGVYHLAAQGQTTWYGFAQTIVAHKTILRKPVVTPIGTADYPLPARRPANSSLSCAKFTSTFCALPQWSDALDLCLD